MISKLKPTPPVRQMQGLCRRLKPDGVTSASCDCVSLLVSHVSVRDNIFMPFDVIKSNGVA